MSGTLQNFLCNSVNTEGPQSPKGKGYRMFWKQLMPGHNFSYSWLWLALYVNCREVVTKVSVFQWDALCKVQKVLYTIVSQIALPRNVLSPGGGELPGATREHRRKLGKGEAEPWSSAWRDQCAGTTAHRIGKRIACAHQSIVLDLKKNLWQTSCMHFLKK